jgi:aconitate hydratase 2/2-methylisocitrate dehydratase
MGKDARVYLGSAELAAVAAKLGRLPSTTEYLDIVGDTITPNQGNIYQYLNFNLMDEYKQVSIVKDKKVLTINVGAVI